MDRLLDSSIGDQIDKAIKPDPGYFGIGNIYAGNERYGLCPKDGRLWFVDRRDILTGSLGSIDAAGNIGDAFFHDGALYVAEGETSLALYRREDDGSRVLISDDYDSSSEPVFYVTELFAADGPNAILPGGQLKGSDYYFIHQTYASTGLPSATLERLDLETGEVETVVTAENLLIIGTVGIDLVLLRVAELDETTGLTQPSGYFKVDSDDVGFEEFEEIPTDVTAWFSHTLFRDDAFMA